MKKIWVFLFTILFFASGAQENFKWELTDTIPKTKNQIYTETKLFIADYWKSAKTVIQNDDKEGGVILLKGITCITKTIALADYTYCYDYTVTFMMKDNKFRIIIDGVYFNDELSDAKLKIKKPFDGEPDLNGLQLGVTKNQWKELMSSLKYDLQRIFDSYSAYIRKNNIPDDW